MAENVHFKYPNFCLGPIAGTFCSINQDSATTILRIKTSAGSLITDYSLSSNIVNELVHLEYAGPSSTTAIMDGLTFFTVEKVSSSRCIIKRWEARPSSSQLNLKSQIIKQTSGLYYYDINSAAVEYYERTFSLHNPAAQNYLNINNTSKITSGTRLFLGPSNDADNLGDGEYVTVSYTAGSTIYLTSDIIYQYVIGDQITFYTDVYLISNLGMSGDTSRGTLFKIDADSGSVGDVNTDKVYRNISSSRWCPISQTVASVSNNNILFINPYASYSNWRSMFLNNIEDNNYVLIPNYDVLFSEYSIYLLANKKTIRDDDGIRATENWGDWYNYVQNTLLPYSNSIEIYTNKSTMIGQNDTTTLYSKVVDQYGVGLSGKTVNFYIESGDFAAQFTPINGQVTTDINGEVNILYTSGASYEGETFISCKTDGASSYTGSQYIWNNTSIFSMIEGVNEGKLDAWDIELGSDLRMRAIASGVSNEMGIYGRSFFTNPGGDWYQNANTAGQAAQYLPDLIIGDGEGPPYGFAAEPPFPDPIEWNPMPNTIHQVEEFESENALQQLADFKCLTETPEAAGETTFTYENPFSIVQQIIESFDLQISQLKTSGHTHWIGVTPYDYLWTDTTLDQFIFVEDAIPKFWSTKNPVDTNIWVRLRPFAYSLNLISAKMFVREVWWGGDAGYVDVSSQLTKQTFDAGGGVLGLELTYNPAQDFHNNAIVYVYIEVYDEAPIPNRITTNYWFEVIPDYKSPYLVNLSPSREQSNVVVDTDIYFEIKDDGAGVDIDTLELYINSRVVTPTSVVKVNDNYYKVTYTPTTNFFFNKRISVGVIVDDLTDYPNWLNDRYAFYTIESDDILFTAFEPGMCKRGLSRFHDVSFIALGIGSGIDRDTLRLQVRDKDVTDKSTIVPVIYRIS